MREIKFRAWVIESPDKRIYKNNTMYGWDVVVDDCNWFIKCNDLQKNSFILMQYTGLKDKNGKEIYEGDILEFEEEDFGFMSEIEKVRREVKWQDRYGAGWNFGTYHKDGEKRWSYPFWSNMEVVGNIYENPELLK